jgi:hypothetical protein
VVRSSAVTALALAVAFGCGAATRPPPRAIEPTSSAIDATIVPTVAIRCTHVGGREWRVDYTLSTPARCVAFQGLPFAFRKKWRPRGPVRLVRTEKADVLVASAPFSTFSIDLTATDEQPEKEYRPFYSFTDEGALVYPAHLAVATATLVRSVRNGLPSGRCRHR